MEQTLSPAAKAARHYVAAIGFVLLAALARAGLDPLVEERAPWVFFFPAVSVAALRLGAVPGLVSLVLSTAIGWFFWVPPTHSFAIVDRAHLYVLLAFLLSGGVIVAFGGSTERGRRRLQEARLQRQAAGHELAESVEAFRGMFDHARGDAVILMDVHRKVLAWNGGAEEILGYKASEALGMRADVVFTPEDREVGAPEKEAALAVEKGAAPDERWHLRKNGERFWANGSLIALHRADGTVRGFLKVLRDETARHELEEARRSHSEALEQRVAERTSDLRAANSELEGFTYSVSHDMRAPLRAIVANASILLEEHDEQLDEDGRERLRRMAAAGRHMGMLVEDLLAYARLNKQELRLLPADLAKIFREVCAEEVGDMKAEIFAPDSLPVECEPGLMRMVMQNLVGNAVKYRKTEGVLKLEFSEVDRDGMRGFEVRDNGIGFEDQYAAKLFEPFERLHRNEEYPGTGIGLANVKRIVERHGGQVWAKGKPGVGATFGFTLPPSVGPSP